ncbi:hypothetical protein TKK_0011205 [Trichogramma kaykai]
MSTYRSHDMDVGLSTIASEGHQLDIEQQPRHDVELDEFTFGCYFSAEYQGEFVMQVNSPSSSNSAQLMQQSLSAFMSERSKLLTPKQLFQQRQQQQQLSSLEPVQYVSLNITFNAIPVWGYCHRKLQDKVLLRDRRGGYGECMRCFRLVRRARNVLQVYYRDLAVCYTDEARAIESCDHLNTSAILYRTSEVGGEKIRNEYCPIAGKYRFKYTVNYDYELLQESNEPESRDECDGFTSELDNCPDGSQLKLRFNRCSFEEHEVSLDCLASWPVTDSDDDSQPGPRNSDAPRYVALLDSRGTTGGSSSEFASGKRRRPRYRCGLYHVDGRTGKTYLSLSSDSSCSLNLQNSTSGYERLVLSKTTTQKKMPSYVVNNLSTFPQWAQGEWEETVIVNGTMTFQDLNGYKSFTFVTVDSDEAMGRYIVFSRDQCEQEAYVCLIMKQRSENVLEFVVGTVSSPVYQPALCNETNLLLERQGAVWWTLARLERNHESPCPITGEYTGRITDVPGMCAELSSNCHTRQLMYYKVYDCESGELYEERTYECLGQWLENGLTYSYTMRQDTQTNECFVGAIVNDEEIYIKEAGDFCARTIDPRTEGMRLYRKGLCLGNSSSPAPTPITSSTTPISSSPFSSSLSPSSSSSSSASLLPVSDLPLASVTLPDTEHRQSYPPHYVNSISSSSSSSSGSSSSVGSAEPPPPPPRNGAGAYPTHRFRPGYLPSSTTSRTTHRATTTAVKADRFPNSAASHPNKMVLWILATTFWAISLA